MARYGKAIWKPITASKGRQRLTVVNRVNLHVAVSEGSSLHNFFNRTGQVDSHFYVRKDGVIEQYVDTDYRAFADLEGNDATISIETQGGVNKPQSEPWTDEQVESLARLFAWAVKEHGVKLRLAEDSKIGSSSKGLSWHRLGVDGNFAAAPSILAGREQLGGGMHYSRSRGKICPGDAKIKQIPSILDRADEILNGGQEEAPKPAPKPVAKPTPKPAPKPVKKPAKKPKYDIKVDGEWGEATTFALQREFGTKADGVISAQYPYREGWNRRLHSAEWSSVENTKPKGSSLIYAMQGWLGIKQDGLAGKQFITALQRNLGTPVDGRISENSQMVRELQRRLREGTLRK